MRPSELQLERLRDGRRVFVDGERVDDVTRYAGFRPLLGTLGALYDECTPPAANALDPDFMLRPPAGRDDLAERRQAVTALARRTHGLLGRLNDYKLSYLVDVLTLRGVLAEADPEVPARLERFVAHCRAARPVLAHAISHPQVDRRLGPAANHAVRVVASDAESITLSGARAVATMAPLADELMILPFGHYAAAEQDLAVSCVVPLGAPGLAIHVRPLDARPDDPLVRFDEPDALVHLDRVRVPRERVFLAGRPDVASKLFAHATPLAYFVALVRMHVKLELLAGVARALLHAIGAAEFSHNRLAIGDAAGELFTVGALIDAAITHARPDAVRDCTMPAMEYVWTGLLRASALADRLLAIITEQAGCAPLVRLDPAALTDERERALIEPLCAGPEIVPTSKAALLRLAWSLALGPVGTRQQLFDRHAFGDPFALRTYLGSRYPWNAGLEQVQRALVDGQRPKR